MTASPRVRRGASSTPRAPNAAWPRTNSSRRAAIGALEPGNGAQRSFVLRAPVAGRVLRVAQTSEANVSPGVPLMEIGDTAQLEIVAELLTTDALTARPGSLVRIERWGGPTVLEGRVRAVEPAAFTKVSALGVEEQRVRVLIDITSTHGLWQELGDGFRVGVRIVVLAQVGVLLVPSSTVFPLPGDNGDGHGVFVAEDGRARQVPVEIGARNASMAWVRTGLAEGQQVIVYPPATVSDGVRVSARQP